jgi:calcineurin-like phosphoesterase family protein
MSEYFFTADEHYNHNNVIHFMNRPFQNIQAMNDTLIQNNNVIVGKDDFVIHAGDFCWKGNADFIRYLHKSLNGNHIFLRGSHDSWMNGSYHEIWEKEINGQHIVVCHYAMRTWGKSHWNSWQLHGHSHGKLPPQGKQYDVGVDTNSYYPVSFTDLVKIMESKDDNFDKIEISRPSPNRNGGTQKGQDLEG